MAGGSGLVRLARRRLQVTRLPAWAGCAGRAAVTLSCAAAMTLGFAAESRAAAAEAGLVSSDSARSVAEGLAAQVTISDGGIPEVLPGAVAGDPSRGRAIVANRQVGLCLLCHAAPIPEERFQGDLATDLAGVGQRATVAQLRLRIADASRLNPDTIMPSYFRVRGLNRVAAAFEGKPILEAQQIEDVVAWLVTLQ